MRRAGALDDVELQTLAPPEARALAAMTFPSYRNLLDLRPQPRHPELGQTQAVQPVAIAARRAGEAVGLALCEVPVEADDTQSPELLSVFVLPEQRRRGIGTALVAAAEEETRRRGLQELAAVYTTGRPTIEWLERILDRRGWEPAEPRSLTVRFTPDQALPVLASRAAESGRHGGFDGALEIFPWSELTADEHEEMWRSNHQRCWIEPSLEPWQFDRRKLDPSSVGARHRGRVVGWVLNHRVQPGLVRFSVSYLRRDLSRRGRILPLYQASLERLRAEGSPTCTFITPYSYPRMVAFVRRWIAPFATFVHQSRWRRITLDPEGS